MFDFCSFYRSHRLSWRCRFSRARCTLYRGPESRTFIALAKLYMPFRKSEILVRANIHKLGIPLQCFTEFKEDTRLLSVAALAHILNASLSRPDSTRALIVAR